MSRLRDNVERWLIHENYDFNQSKADDAAFKIVINNSDGLGNDTEVFEPKGQKNILVIGIIIKCTDRALISTPMGTNTSVNLRTAITTDKVPTII